jgi:integrase
MGTVFKKRVTRPLPANATIETKRRRATGKELRRNPEQVTITEQVATWRDRTGKKRTAVVVVAADGSQRIRVESATYYCQFRDGDGLHREKPTGCRDRTAAEAKLAAWEKTAERVRSEVVTTAELDTAGHLNRPVAEHLDDYERSLTAAGVSKRHVFDTLRLAKTIVRDRNFLLLRDLNADSVERWLVDKKRLDMAPRTRNSYLQALNGFCNWCVDAGRLFVNPLERVKRADESTDRRRTRRALAEAELRRLFFVARWRPLAEFGREPEPLDPDKLPTNKKSRKTWKLRPLSFNEMPATLDRARLKLADNPAFVFELERRGWERSLVYKLAVLTGLRRGEIESLTVGHLHLDTSTPFVRMESKDTKNREAVDVPLRGDLAGDLRQWVDSLRNPIRRDVVSMQSPVDLSPMVRLFNVPQQLVKNLDRDLKAAGIPKQDERGRTIDVHAMRHTFGTLLSTSGVAPRTAQQAMRHSRIDLTMNVYTDPRLLDVAGAVDALPDLSLDDTPAELQRQVATGTDNYRGLDARTVAKTVANNSDFPATFRTTSDKLGKRRQDPENEKTPADTGVCAIIMSDADGARTRNHRIDSPVL